MKVIDFRLRPPFGGFLSVGMYADKNAADFYANNIGMKRSNSAVLESMELLFEEMDENHISKGVVTGRQGHRKGSVDNAELALLLEKWPDRFIGLAGLNAADVDGSIEQIKRYCIEGPLKGVALEPGAMPSPLYADNARLYPIYKVCEKYGIPVQLMVGGRAGPDRSYSRPEMISRLAEDFPGINFIVAHGCWPYVREILGICFYQENIYLCPDLYFFNLPGQEDYIKAASHYLQDRFLFASAYPFTPLNCVNEFKKFFPRDILSKLLYENAARLLKLE